MSKIETKGAITISRIGRDDSDVISIEIRDNKSRSNFLKIEMTTSDFAIAVTGLAYVDCNLKLSSLDNIGKTKVTETKVIKVDGKELRESGLSRQDWFKANAQADEGWAIDYFLGSQGSIFEIEGLVHFRYSVYKYVDGE